VHDYQAVAEGGVVADGPGRFGAGDSGKLNQIPRHRFGADPRSADVVPQASRAERQGVAKCPEPARAVRRRAAQVYAFTRAAAGLAGRQDLPFQRIARPEVPLLLCGGTQSGHPDQAKREVDP